MFFSWFGMQGAVHGLSCVVGFTVRLGQLVRSCSGVCVCSRGSHGGMSDGTLMGICACSFAQGKQLGVSWWACHCWPSGCFIFRVRWEPCLSGLGQQCVDRQQTVGQEHGPPEDQQRAIWPTFDPHLTHI